MQVFRVEEDVERFQTLVPASDDIWETETLIFDGKPKSSWRPPEVVVFNPLEKRGNFFYLTPGCLVFDERVLQVMDDLLEMAGQILELPCNGETLYVLNVLECINALDPSSSEWRIDNRSGRRLTLKRYAFRNGFLSESSLFKIPETVRAEVLVYSGVKDRGDEFMGRYFDSNLAGLKFHELWRQD